MRRHELRRSRTIGRVLNLLLARITVVGGGAAGERPRAARGEPHRARRRADAVGLLPRPVAFLVKAGVFRGPLGALLRHTGQIPVRRGTVETGPLWAALSVPGGGGIVGVFPEGTRGAGDVQQIRHGIAYLAVRSGAPVVPVAGHGALARSGRAFFRPRRPEILVAFGDPLRLPAGPAARRTVAAAADEIQRALAAHVAATRSAPTEPERDQP